MVGHWGQGGWLAGVWWGGQERGEKQRGVGQRGSPTVGRGMWGKRDARRGRGASAGGGGLGIWEMPRRWYWVSLVPSAESVLAL